MSRLFRLVTSLALCLPQVATAQRPEPAGPQPVSACTFDTCSLRIEPRVFLGEQIVVGNGRQIRELGVRGRTLVDLTQGHEYAQREARISMRHRTRAVVVSLLTAATWATLTAIWLQKTDRDLDSPLFLSGTTTLLIGGTWTGYHAARAGQHQSRAVWAYNRDLPR